MKLIIGLSIFGILFLVSVLGMIAYDGYNELFGDDPVEMAKVVARESQHPDWGKNTGNYKYYGDGSERPLSERGKNTIKGENDLFWITMLLTAIMFFGCSSRTMVGLMSGGILAVIILILICIQGC